MSDGKAEAPDDGNVRMMDYFMQLEYHEPLCPVVRRYAEELLEGRIIAHKCPSCGLVYAPPRGYCPICVVETTDADEVVLADRGVITNYTVVTPVQYYGQQETEPFVRASILLDGVGGMMNLQDIVDVPVEDVHVGQRVEAVWKPAGERSIDEITNRSWGGAEGCIVGWRLTGEPDVPADQLKGRVF
ncbi:MAG TPA: OB-fold domain-containing protein [Acidimicrobiia bacterium]|nr:OB-fold domain-containing protein [Acidimicrobiia bacterium]